MILSAVIKSLFSKSCFNAIFVPLADNTQIYEYIVKINKILIH